MQNDIKLLDTVIATLDFADESVLAGDLGTVVETFTKPTQAYEVEFVNPDGTTRALLTLLPNQIRPPSGEDVITTRSLFATA